MSAKTTIQLKRKESGGVASNTTKPAIGEPVWDKANNHLYVGDGSNTLAQLTTDKKYFFDRNELETWGGEIRQAI